MCKTSERGSKQAVFLRPGLGLVHCDKQTSKQEGWPPWGPVIPVCGRPSSPARNSPESRTIAWKGNPGHEFKILWLCPTVLRTESTTLHPCQELQTLGPSWCLTNPRPAPNLSKPVPSSRFACLPSAYQALPDPTLPFRKEASRSLKAYKIVSQPQWTESSKEEGNWSLLFTI